MDKPRIIDLNYHYHAEITDPVAAVQKHLPTNLFLHELTGVADILMVKHINHEGAFTSRQIRYHFFRRRNHFSQVPISTHRFIKRQHPDIVVIQGLIYPLQVIALRQAVGKNCRIILQHQGETPYRRKRIFQRIADRYTDAYIFTCYANAEPWINAGIIKNRDKCFEIAEASTVFSKRDKGSARQKLNLDGGLNFLWVGRLNANKDPLTALSGFEKYAEQCPGAKLIMIYGDDQLLGPVRERIAGSATLRDQVSLQGRVGHAQLEDWYNACDYFLAASHREGGGYALKEAMACGCVPVVSDIPPFMKTINGGKAGYFYKTGDSDDLYRVLSGLKTEKLPEMSLLAEEEFKSRLSPAAIAGDFLSLYTALKTK